MPTSARWPGLLEGEVAWRSHAGGVVSTRGAKKPQSIPQSALQLTAPGCRLPSRPALRPAKASGNPEHRPLRKVKGQTASRSHRTLRERPLTRRGPMWHRPLRENRFPIRSTEALCYHRRSDAQCAPLRRRWRDCAKNLLCARFSPCSGAVCAAFEETTVAVTAIRFHCLARSREGGGSMGRDGPVERNGLGDAASWDARRAA